MNRRCFATALSGAVLLPSHALAALKSVPTLDIPHSRGLGITLAEWETLHGQPDQHDALSVTYRLDAGEYAPTLYPNIDTGQIQQIDVECSQVPTSTRAALVTTSLLPVDTMQTGQLVPDPAVIVLEEYHSDWLAASQKPDSTGNPLWPNAQPGDFIVVLAAKTGQLDYITIALGNDSTLYTF